MRRRAIIPVPRATGQFQAGFTLVEVMIVAGIVALLAAIAVPAFLHYTAESRKTTCINNLRQIDLAIQQWALEQKKGPTASVEYGDISPYLKGPVYCPSGGTSFEDSYSISTVAADPICRRCPKTHVWMGGAVKVASRPE
jgi:prepilin-type N-terminal cleavage/methylation domain-containing protein